MHDGRRLRHAPLRLAACIDAPPDTLAQALAAQPLPRQLAENGWLHLYCVHGDTPLRWHADGGWDMTERRAALLTRHGKHAAIAPALAGIGWDLALVDSFDTDSLGAFTGETPRAGSQLDAALAKARLACELSGLRYGIGSEGSFGGDPWLGRCGWATELLLCWTPSANTRWKPGRAGRKPISAAGR
ncbi:Uncharacterized protein conserved in bacteria [Chromobacterium violaceum]|uniref:Uncharacterized protein conserved in bacteria n=1 Tax=Chromobacterium violaceum TaxID=536 RepID=A0A3S4LK63_CHRVL|nr:Uncharacterized protein conserved in bacteria [Chromobacterium violaceum]